jgi:mRNA interferase RelE/StbE
VYQVEYSKKAVKSLSKLDKQTMTLLINWIEKNLVNCQNPRFSGKPLVGNKSGYWRYRIGDYRIVSEINDKNVTILLIRIAHRKEIYEQ